MQVQDKYGLDKLSLSVMKSLEWYELPFSFIKSVAEHKASGLF